MPKPFLLLRLIILLLFLEMMPSLVSAQPIPYRSNWAPTKKQIKGYTFYRPFIINGQHFNTKNWYVQQSADYKYKDNAEPDTFTYIYYYDKGRTLFNENDSFIEVKQYKFRKAYYPYYYNYYYYWHFNIALQWIPEVSTSFYEDKNRVKERYLDSSYFNIDSQQSGYVRYKFNPDPVPFSKGNYILDKKGIQIGSDYAKWNGSAWKSSIIQLTDTFYNAENNSTEIIWSQNHLEMGYYSSGKTVLYFDAKRKLKNLANYYFHTDKNSWIPSDSFSDINWFFYDKDLHYSYYHYGNVPALYRWAKSYKTYNRNMKDSAWRPAVNIYREFNKDSLITSETYVLAKTQFPNADSINLSRTNISYYTDGSQKIYQVQYWRDNTWKTTYSSFTRNTYDADGDIVYSSQIIEQEGDFQPEEQFRVYYRYYDAKPYRRKPPVYEYKVYPNPTEDELNITVPDADSASFKISVYNTIGQQVMQLDQNIRDFKLSLKDLPAGMYFLAFESRNGQKIIKIIKAQSKFY